MPPFEHLQVATEWCPGLREMPAEPDCLESYHRTFVFSGDKRVTDWYINVKRRGGNIIGHSVVQLTSSHGTPIVSFTAELPNGAPLPYEDDYYPFNPDHDASSEDMTSL